MANLLLLSNSTMPGEPFFGWAAAHVKKFLPPGTGNLLFIPYAAVTFSFDEYEEKVAGAFREVGVVVRSIHRFDDAVSVVQQAHGIVVGGGNTFALLDRLYTYKLLDAIRHQITQGVPYIGWSAGSNVASPSIMTTNDMPIVQPPSLQSLGLVSFQINPHYHELKFPGQGGETRLERLTEYLAMNREVAVVGLPEGTFIRRQGSNLTFEGTRTGKLFRFNQEIQRSHLDRILVSCSTAEVRIGKSGIRNNQELGIFFNPARALASPKRSHRA